MSYDNINFLTSINHQKRSNSQVIANYAYSRDNIGNITKITTTRGDFAFVYDSNNQLTNATHPEDITSVFMYDSLGNRISDQFGNYNYDNKRQRLTEDWKYQYTYDENGNISSRILKSDNSKVTSYIHNSQNQLVKIQEYVGTNLNKETSYYYDVLGRRVQKSHIDFQANSNSFERKFTYDGQEILTELDQNNNVKSIFTHSNLRTDDVLAVDKQGTSYFFLKDHLGTVNDIIDSNGNLVQHYIYSPFGKIRKIENASGADISATPMLDNFYTFTGREYDKESGLFYYRARYLDSEAGRFIEADPDSGSLESPESFLSSFIYANNNSLTNLDPNGEFSLRIGHSFSQIFAATLSLANGLPSFVAHMYARNNLSDRTNRIIDYSIIMISAAAVSYGFAGEGWVMSKAVYEDAIVSAAFTIGKSGNLLVNFSKSFSPSAYASGVLRGVNESLSAPASVEEDLAANNSNKCLNVSKSICWGNARHVPGLTAKDIINGYKFVTITGEYLLKITFFFTVR